MGWTGAKTTRALALAVDEPVVVDDAPAWVTRGDHGTAPDVGPWAASCPGLDPTTMGWKGRAWYLDPIRRQRTDRHLRFFPSHRPERIGNSSRRVGHPHQIAGCDRTA